MCCSDSSCRMFAIIWSVVQTLFHIGFCSWGMQMYECKIDLGKTPSPKYFLYLTYFYTDSCQNVTLEKLGFNVPNFTTPAPDSKSEKPEVPTIEFPSQSAAASRTYDIFHAFLITDILWLISTVGLLVGTVFNITLQASVLLSLPWNTLLLVVLFFDAVCTFWFGSDISHTYGVMQWFTFVGVKQTGLDRLEKEVPKIVTTAPSILMMSIFSRFIIIWIVNLFLLFRMIKASINACKDFDNEYDDDDEQTEQSS